MRLDTFVTESTDTDPYDIVVEVYKKALPFILEMNKTHNITLGTKLLLSGRHHKSPIFTKAIMKGRSPKDTPYNAHLFLDNLFYKMFRVRARSNSIFVTGKYNTAKGYGNNVYGIFPNGSDYKLIWSDKVQDLYSDVIDSGEHTYAGMDEDDLTHDMVESSDLDDEAYSQLNGEFMDMYSTDDYDTDEEYDKDKESYIDTNMDERLDKICRMVARDKIEDSEYDLEQLIKKDYSEGNVKLAIASDNEIMLSSKSYTAVRYEYLAYVLKYMQVNKNKQPTPELFINSIKGETFREFPRREGEDPAKRMKNINKRILGKIDISDLTKP